MATLREEFSFLLVLVLIGRSYKYENAEGRNTIYGVGNAPGEFLKI